VDGKREEKFFSLEDDVHLEDWLFFEPLPDVIISE